MLKLVPRGNNGPPPPFLPLISKEENVDLKMSTFHLALDSSKSMVLVNLSGKFVSIKDCRNIGHLFLSANRHA